MQVSALSLALFALVAPAACFDGSIQADSKFGQKILGKARQLENNNNYYS
jgi:hypothetical protein